MGSVLSVPSLWFLPLANAGEHSASAAVARKSLTCVCPRRVSGRAQDIDTAQFHGQPAKAVAPQHSVAAPSAPPATASLLGGPSAPPATASLLAMLQPQAAQSQSGVDTAMATHAAGTQGGASKAAEARTISSVVATLGSFLGLGSHPTASSSPFSMPGSSGGVPPPPQPLAAGFDCR